MSAFGDEPLPHHTNRHSDDPGGGSADTSAIRACAFVPHGGIVGDVIYDAQDWAVADVLLFEATEHPLSGRIRSLQALGYPKSSQWTHAALYVGDGWVIEALAFPVSEVKRTPIVDFSPDRRCLRLHDPLLTDEQRARIASKAGEWEHRPYSHTRIAEIAAHLWKTRKPGFDLADTERERANEESFVCSDVVIQAYYAGATILSYGARELRALRRSPKARAWSNCRWALAWSPTARRGTIDHGRRRRAGSRYGVPYSDSTGPRAEHVRRS